MGVWLSQEERQALKALRKHIGESLCTARRKKGITLRDCAEKVGMRPSRIDDYERGKGKMELENIIRIASVLEISPKVLFEKKEISL